MSLPTKPLPLSSSPGDSPVRCRSASDFEQQLVRTYGEIIRTPELAQLLRRCGSAVLRQVRGPGRELLRPLPVRSAQSSCYRTSEVAEVLFRWLSASPPTAPGGL